MLGMKETQVQSLGWEDPLEEEMATHSSIFTWEIPWTEEPGRLLSIMCVCYAQSCPTLCNPMDPCVLHLLQWQAGSLPLAPPGKPKNHQEGKVYSRLFPISLRYKFSQQPPRHGWLKFLLFSSHPSPHVGQASNGGKFRPLRCPPVGQEPRALAEQEWKEVFQLGNSTLLWKTPGLSDIQGFVSSDDFAEELKLFWPRR